MKQSDVVKYAIQVLENLGIEYMVVGSVASSAYGDPRLTRDVDIVIRPEPGQMSRLCAAFPEDEYYVSLEAAIEAEARHDQFNVIHSTSGNKIDFLIAHDTAWGREQFARKRRARLYQDQEGFMAAPEDIIISKMMSYHEGGSEKHLRDIAGILKVGAERIDHAYMARWASDLGLTEIWQAVLDRVGKS